MSNYLIYKSNTYSSSFLNSNSGVSYYGNNINDLSSFISDGQAFNYGLGLIYHGNFYGRSSYYIFKSEDGIGNPTLDVDLGASVAGGQLLDYVNGYLVNYNAKKFLDGDTVKTLTAPIKAKVFYDSINNVYFQVDTKNVYQFDSLDSPTYRTYALPATYKYNQVTYNEQEREYEIIEEDGQPKEYDYKLSNTQGIVQFDHNKVWVSSFGLMNGLTPNILIDSFGNTEVIYNRSIYPIDEDGKILLSSYYFRNNNYYLPGINKSIMITDNKILIDPYLSTDITSIGLSTEVGIPTGISFGLDRTIIDDFVNSRILIGSNTTGCILVLDYEGNVISYEIKDTADETKNYNVKAMYNLYKEVKLSIIGNGNSTYTHNGVKNPYESSLNLCVNNDDTLKINFSPKTNYVITSLTSNLGVVNLEDNSVTYNNVDSYIEDEINITTEFAIKVTSGWYNLKGIINSLSELEKPIEISLNGEVYASNGLDYDLFNFTKITINGIDDFVFEGVLEDYIPIHVFELKENQAVSSDIIKNAFSNNITEKVNIINLSFNVSENINYTILNSLGDAKSNAIFAQNGIIASLYINSPYWLIDKITFEKTEDVNVYGKNTITYNTDIEGEISITINASQKPNSLTLNLYHNNSDDKVLNKSLELITTVKGNFKSIVDIDEPVIDIRYDGLLNASYVYLEELKNYYFVNKHEQINYNTWRLYLIKDSLMSNKEKISSLNAYVLRSTNYYDETLDDNLIPLKNSLNIEEIELGENGFLIDLNNIEWNCVVVLSAKPSTGVINLVEHDEYTPTSPGNDVLPSVLEFHNNFNGVGIYILRKQSLLQDFLLWLNNTEDFKSLFIGAYYYPFNLLNIPNYNIGGIVRNANLGRNFRINGSNGNVDFFSSEDMPAEAWFAEVKFLNRYILSSFTIEDENTFIDINGKYELFIPYVGWIQIQREQYINNLIEVSYIFDLENGRSSVAICDLTNNKLLYVNETQVGISINTTFDNTVESENQRKQLTMNLLLGTLGGALATVGGAVTGNAMAVAGGLLTLGGSISNSVMQMNNLFTKASASINSGNTGIYLPNKVRLRTSKQEFAVDIDDFAEKFGRIYCKNRVLGTIRGFVSATGIKLDDFGEISKKEKDEIIRLLENGIYTH